MSSRVEDTVYADTILNWFAVVFNCTTLLATAWNSYKEKHDVPSLQAIIPKAISISLLFVAMTWSVVWTSIQGM